MRNDTALSLRQGLPIAVGRLFYFTCNLIQRKKDTAEVGYLPHSYCILSTHIVYHMDTIITTKIRVIPIWNIMSSDIHSGQDLLFESYPQHY